MFYSFSTEYFSFIKKCAFGLTGGALKVTKIVRKFLARICISGLGTLDCMELILFTVHIKALEYMLLLK